jgi:hypothetical protein
MANFRNYKRHVDLRSHQALQQDTSAGHIIRVAVVHRMRAAAVLDRGVGGGGEVRITYQDFVLNPR